MQGYSRERSGKEADVLDKPTVVVSEQIPSDMEPAAEKQGYDNVEQRIRGAGAEWQESVAVGIGQGGNKGSANPVKDPERQETNGQAEDEGAENRMGEVFPVVNRSG